MGRPKTPIGNHGAITCKKQPTGKWRARTRYRFEDGSYRQVECFRDSKTRAEAALRGEIARLQSYGSSLSKAISLTQLAGQFLALKEDSTAPSTVALYSRTIELHIVPKIGQLSIVECTPQRLQVFVDSIRRSVGAATAKTCRNVLSGMLAMAVRNGALRENPVRQLERIRQVRHGAQALSRDSLQDLLDAVKSDKRMRETDLADVIQFMAFTGARIGEALAMRVSDLDLASSKISINGTVTRVSGVGHFRQDHPKTSSSNRTITIAIHLRDVLAKRLDMDTVRYSGLLFPTVQGNLRDQQNTNRDWRLARERLGLGEVRLHAFRKSVATLLDQGGLSARDIAEQLGHASPSMTQDVYMDRRIGTERAAKLIEGVLPRS